MLIRKTTDTSFECISQEQHALVSGILAAAWNSSRLDPLLVQVIGAHDNPWRAADAHPLLNASTGLPHDFITFPMAQKIELYRRGIDALEDVDPWLASMVSHHYVTFSGTRNIEGFQQTEAARRARLSKIISPEHLAQSDNALKWLKFFDIFSLTICLTGPNALPDEIPKWLQNQDGWATAPDGSKLKLHWQGDNQLFIENWPFAQKEILIQLNPRILTQKMSDQETLDLTWRKIPLKIRDISLHPAER